CTASTMSASVAAEIRFIRSKARQVCKGQPALFDMHVSLFDAGGQRRKDLSRIEQTTRIKGAFEALLLREIRLAEHNRHQLALFQTNAMFAGQDAADLDAEPEDVCAKGFGTREFIVLHHV